MGAALLVGCTLAGCGAPSTPTQAQRADVSHYIQARLDDAWRGDGRLDRPSPVTPRFLLPNGWGFAMKQCMIDSGFEGFDYDRSGGFTNGFERTSSAGEEGLAWYYCGARFPTYDTVFSELDEQQLDELYAYYTEWLIPCLALEGSAVLRVPSRAQFGDGGLGQPGSWNPYLTAKLPSTIAVASVLVDSCAPYPNGWTTEREARP